MSPTSSRIAERRRQLGISQEDLADILGTHQRQISRYETGQNDPTAEVLAAIARALNTTPDWLLGFTENLKPLQQILSEDERQLLEIYRGKPAETRRKVLEVARVL